jgi:hypothetical protein
MGKYIYALCRSYEEQSFMLGNERKITLGLEEQPIIAETFSLFLDEKNNYVARLDFLKKGNGVLIGVITDHLEQRPVQRTIPIDDLVKEENIVNPVK